MLVRADPADPLERGAERVRRAVADGAGHRADGLPRVEDEVGGQGQPPLGEELHRRLADDLGEAPGQGGPGHPGLVRQRADGPGLGRAFLQQPHGLADHGIALGPVPAGRGLLGAGEVGAHRVDQQQVEQPVQDGVLADLVPQHLGGEQAERRRLPFITAQHQPRRQRVKQAAADLALGVVGAGQDLGGTVRRVAPAAHAERAHLRDLLPVRRGAALIGVDDRLRRRGRVVGEQVVVRAEQDRHVAAVEPFRLAPVESEAGPAPQHGHQAQRRLVPDVQRPGRIQGAAEQEGTPRAGPVEQSGDRVHAWLI